MRKLTTADIVSRFKAHLGLLQKDDPDDLRLSISVRQLRALVNAVRDDGEQEKKPGVKPEDTELHTLGFNIEYPAGIRTIVGFDSGRFAEHLAGRLRNADTLALTHAEKHALECLAATAHADGCLLDNSLDKLEALLDNLQAAINENLQAVVMGVRGKDEPVH